MMRIKIQTYHLQLLNYLLFFTMKIKIQTYYLQLPIICNDEN